VKRKITITIEKKCGPDEIFSELVLFALKEHVQYIEDHIDEELMSAYDDVKEFPLESEGEMQTVNRCLLKWTQKNESEIK